MSKFGKIEILLVEDTVANQKLATIILKKLGYDNVELAESGQRAVHMCMEKKYDIILMDCQMPIMDGYQASINIRNHKLNKDTVIIAMTANAMQEDRDKCLASGMNDYISKPIIIPLLDSMIKKWIG